MSSRNGSSPRPSLFDLTRPASVVFLTIVPPQPYLRERFHLDGLRDAGIQVEIWYASFCIPASSVDESLIARALPCRVIGSLAEFERALKAHVGNSFILLTNFELKTAALFDTLHRHGKALIYYAWGVFPRVSLAALKRSPARILRSIRYRLALAAHRRRYGAEFDVVCHAGSAAKETVRSNGPYIPVNFPDWELARGLSQAAPVDIGLGATPYVVFLDNYLPFHPDFALSGLKQIDPENYIRRLSRLFDKMEAHFGVRVVVAAHPKAAYPPDYFRGRPLLQGKTAELVRGCSAVVSHHSLSSTFAVIFRKPIFFACFSELQDPAYEPDAMPIMLGLSNALNMPMLNLDELPEEISWPVLDETRYGAYEKKYITERSDGRGNFEILRDLLLGRHLAEEARP